MTTEKKNKKTLMFNILFLGSCLGIFIFLLMAPPESTTKLPLDENHIKFHAMDKKEAEKYCETCHFPEGSVPLPKIHPPKYRCLFCHKKQQ